MRYLLIIFLTMMVFTTFCSSKSSLSNTNNTEKKIRTEKVNRPVFLPEDTLVLDEYTLKFGQLKSLENKFLQLDFNLKNTSEGELHFDLSASYIKVAGELVHLKKDKNKTLKFNMLPGESFHKKLIFEVFYPIPPIDIIFIPYKDDVDFYNAVRFKTIR